jgi:hypothetical protein
MSLYSRMGEYDTGAFASFGGVKWHCMGVVGRVV